MRIAILFALSSAITLPGHADEPGKETAGRLKGNWTAISIKASGRVAPEDFVKTFKCTFGDKTYTNTVGDDAMESGDYSVIDTEKPSTIDFDIKSGPDQGKKQLGIFKVDDNKLTIVVAAPDSKRRPGSFKPEADVPFIEFVLQRAKP